MAAGGIGGLTASMDTDFYMKLLLAELKNQDPMDPMSNTEMMTQMAQLSTVEAVRNLTASFTDMLKLQRLLNGTQLLGRQVEYTDGESVQVGSVGGLSNRDGMIRLLVNGTEISLDDVYRIF